MPELDLIYVEKISPKHVDKPTIKHNKHPDLGKRDNNSIFTPKVIERGS